LYGTTFRGGTNSCGSIYGPCGTVFSITLGRAEKVLHNFAGPPSDGAGPQSGLNNVGGTLYGTTSAGGAYGYGTVFSITLSGHETVLYSFKGGQDGANPRSGLSYVNGTFYGTTTFGGSHNLGTVFSITP
jgi:uncharacterized repeat protein (TIGR03803 family)